VSSRTVDIGALNLLCKGLHEPLSERAFLHKWLRSWLLVVVLSKMISFGRQRINRWRFLIGPRFIVSSLCLMLAANPLSARQKLLAHERQSRFDTATGPITGKKSGTAFFVDDSGDLLTAGHIVDDCLSVVVTKEGRVLPAQVEAFSRQPDLALVKVSTTLGLAAVFPRDITPSANDMVFAAAYDSLPAMIAAGNILSNATVVAEDAGSGSLSIDSSVTFGASGAPVLDGRALVQGVISRRTPEDHVDAVSAAQAKAFLEANGIAIAEDDRPQIAALGSRANRAASISAGITCFQP
jgi:S1-C subfamily serine protease